jgi:hypothetical protein
MEAFEAKKSESSAYGALWSWQILKNTKTEGKVYSIAHHVYDKFPTYGSPQQRVKNTSLYMGDKSDPGDCFGHPRREVPKSNRGYYEHDDSSKYIQISSLVHHFAYHRSKRPRTFPK